MKKLIDLSRCHTLGFLLLLTACGGGGGGGVSSAPTSEQKKIPAESQQKDQALFNDISKKLLDDYGLKFSYDRNSKYYVELDLNKSIEVLKLFHNALNNNDIDTKKFHTIAFDNHLKGDEKNIESLGPIKTDQKLGLITMNPTRKLEEFKVSLSYGPLGKLNMKDALLQKQKSLKQMGVKTELDFKFASKESIFLLLDILKEFAELKPENITLLKKMRLIQTSCIFDIRFDRTLVDAQNPSKQDIIRYLEDTISRNARFEQVNNRVATLQKKYPNITFSNTPELSELNEMEILLPLLEEELKNSQSPLRKLEKIGVGDGDIRSYRFNAVYFPAFNHADTTKRFHEIIESLRNE